MVTIEEEAIKLFEQGKKPKEVYEILSGKGIETSLSTIKEYYKVCTQGFKSRYEYLKDLARKKGFESWYEYQKELVKKRGFKDYSKYCEYLKDPYFKEIYYSNGSDGINEDNPYILMSRILEMKDKLKERITETEEYEKLEEILKNIEPTKRVNYIGKLRRGVEILIELRKIDYDNVTILYSV
ncbi:MAG: hypothetical protein J7J15_02000 [Candidatus Aenigmarchaeota archaeon]|nr:hypothetical protein [Candidatus Aenigmarchaeota archaeon]